MAKDLTTGKPSSVLIKFAIPMILANIFQQLYNLADSIIAGNVLGVNALSATSVSYPVTLIYTGIAIGASQGAAVVIANLMGSRRYRDMSTAVGTTLLSMLAASAVLTVVGVLVCDPVLQLLKTDEIIFADSSDYLAIYTYGVPFVMLYNAATAAFNAMGDSRTPLILLICSSVVNVVLDLVFTVEQCGICWGVSGLAWATFIAQGAACVASLVWMFVKLRRLVRAEESESERQGRVKPFSLSQLRSILHIAVPSMLQQLFVPVGLLFVQAVVNGFSPSVIAGYTAAVKVNTMCISCNNMLGNAMSAYTAQNLAVAARDRVKSGLKWGNVLALSVSAAFLIVSLTCSRFLIGLFAGSQDAGFDEMVDAGKLFLTITSPFYLLVGVELVFNGLHRGEGKMLLFMLASSSASRFRTYSRRRWASPAYAGRTRSAGSSGLHLRSGDTSYRGRDRCRGFEGAPFCLSLESKARRMACLFHTSGKMVPPQYSPSNAARSLTAHDRAKCALPKTRFWRGALSSRAGSAVPRDGCRQFIRVEQVRFWLCNADSK